MKMKAKDPVGIEGTELVGVNVIATITGLTPQRIGQLVAEGVIKPAVEAKRGRKYRIDETVRQYIAYKESKWVLEEDGPTQEQLEREKLATDIELKRTKLEVEQKRLDELNGKLHRSEDVVALTGELMTVTRALLLALPGRAAIDGFAAESPAALSAVLRKEVYAILNEIADYDYDPQRYARIVQERERWMAAYGDDESDDYSGHEEGAGEGATA